MNTALPPPRSNRWLRSCLGAAVLFCLMAASWAATLPPDRSGALTAKELAQGYRDGRVLAKPRAAFVAGLDQVEAAEGLTLRNRFTRFGNLRVVNLAAGDSVTGAIARLRATGRYDYVEPDFIRHASKVPDDPDFPSQWALNNTGSDGGVAGADIHAESAWDSLTSTVGTKALVGVIDSGALLTHQDLAANFWVNATPGTSYTYDTGVEGETGSASTTVTDSTNGLNAVARTGAPADDLGHGTHVSGIIGAVGNNALGVSGVAWSTQLMELKFIDSTDMGSTADELVCIEYAIAHKVTVINASYGDSGFSQAEMDAIQAAGVAGIVFVCAAGNASANVDISPYYPADYPLDNIICVGASDNRDLPAYFSNFGSGSVELFAPGDNVYSTYFSSTSSYAYLSGTSMSAPFVTGTVALLQAKYPSDTYRETINRVLNSVDVLASLAGKCQTGGRLDLATALTAASTPPNATFAKRTKLVGLDPYTRSNNADAPVALESGAPSLASGAGRSLWWEWTAPEDAEVEIDTSGTGGGQFPGGSTYATALGVYTGTSLASLASVASNLTYGTESLEGSTGTVGYSQVSFHVAAGATYEILVQGQSGASGQTILAINTTPDNDAIATPRILSGASTFVMDANENATRSAGEPDILGTVGGHSLWYSWTAPKSGPAQAAAYSYDFPPALAVYTGTTYSNLSLVKAATGATLKGSDTGTSTALVAFTATAGTTYLIAVDGLSSSGTGEFTLSLDDALWQVATGDAITCSPAVGSDGTVYIGGDDNTFYAYTAAGTLKWSYAATGAFDTSSAAIATDGTVYAGNEDGHLYAFTAAGALKWKYTLPTTAIVVDSSPALAADGTIYFEASDGNLYALNTDGTLKWTFVVGSTSYAAPTIAPDGTIYLGTDSGYFYAVTAAGAQKWKFTAPVSGEEIYTAAAIDGGGNVYFGTLSGNFYSLDATGAQRWVYAAGNGITSAPALASGAAYFGGYDGNLYSVNLTGGALNWKYPLGAQVRASAPAVDANGVVYIGCYDHNVYAVNAGGALVRTYATDDYIRSSPVISGTRLYFGSEDHRLYAFDLGVGPSAGAWPMYQYDGARLGRAAATVISEPASASLSVGETLSLSVGANGPGTLTYQWYLNGTAIAGATAATYTVVAATAADAGTYTVTVTSATGPVTSTAATVMVGASSGVGAGHLVNLSARADVGTGGNILIAGFVLQGSGAKNVVLRGIGPTLAASPFNLTGVLATPQLTLSNATSTALDTVAAWGGSAALANAFAAVGAFALPAGSADAAVEVNLTAGAYTSEVAGLSGGTGIALAEIYDADVESTASSLGNISARAEVGTGGNILIAGFVVEGGQSVQVLLRGAGPALAAAPFNLTGVLATPQIELYDSTNTVIQSNAGWAGSATLAAAFSEVGAFAFASGSADAAMIATLPAGSYTLELSGVGGGTGIGLIEVYLLP